MFEFLKRVVEVCALVATKIVEAVEKAWTYVKEKCEEFYDDFIINPSLGIVPELEYHPKDLQIPKRSTTKEKKEVEGKIRKKSQHGNHDEGSDIKKNPKLPKVNDKKERTTESKKQFAEQIKLRESQRKSAPVCPKKTLCEGQNCTNQSNILCSECNIHLCNDCYENLNFKPNTHCINSKTIQKILPSTICSVDKNESHPYDCFLKKCKHVFHKKCLVENYDQIKKCLLCLDDKTIAEFKLTDISTDFFDPEKDPLWKEYPLILKKAK